MIFDTHSHINTKQFSQDLVDVIKRAKDSGVGYILIPGMDDEHNITGIKLAEQYNELYTSIGIHPVDVDKASLEKLEPLLKVSKKIVAIGEIGIDLYWRKDNLPKQLSIFIKQVELAIKYDLPILVHTRESFDQVYQALLPYKGKIKGVFHCFSSTLENAYQAVELGFYLGISGVVTFPNAKELQTIVKSIPLEKLVVETDAPYLTPQPFRGKRNEPSYVNYVVEKIAELKNVSVLTVVNQTTNTALKLFKIGG